MQEIVRTIISIMRTYNIQFEGHWMERNKSDVPAKSGVYMVYRGKYNQVNNSVDLYEIIYIGQSINMRERITNHDHIQAFEATLNYGETLCYSCAAVDEKDLDIVENALIIAQKPRLNEIKQSNLDYSEKRFQVSGRCSLLKFNDFTITSKK